MGVCIYPEACRDFSSNGLGLLTPMECTVEEQAGGMYELTLVHPVDESLRWAQITPGCILRAPCPVRETPLYESCISGGDTAATVVREIYKANTERMYLRQSPQVSAVKLCSLPHRTEVVLLEYGGGKWARVAKVQGGQSGWCPFGGLTHVRSVTETLVPGETNPTVIELTQSREQLFRIYSVEQDSTAGTVTARARHIFYDAAGEIIVGRLSPVNESAGSVIAAMQPLRVGESGVDIISIGLTAPVTGDYGFKNPVQALLDPDGGILPQTGAFLIRDNFDATLIPARTRDRGVTVRRGKNLTGLQAVSDASSLATRILPVGRTAGGDPLYIEEVFVDSPRPHSVTRIRMIEYDVQVGENGISSAAEARAELRRRAAAEFENGADLPTAGMDVDFVLLQNTAEYANYASLQAVHLYDTVTVIDERIALKAKLMVTGYRFDCLTGQYRGVTLGRLESLEQAVYAYTLPEGGVSGTKIAPGTLSGTALRSAAIQYAKISNAAVEQLSADAITALTARVREITADRLSADELCAAYAEMLAMKVGSLGADSIETDSLAAELARFTVLAAGTAEFDRATVTHLVSRAMNLEFGTAGQVFIQNLAVEYAQMVSASVGELCIRAADGDYYLLDVAPDGTVTAAKASVSEGETAAGQTAGGKVILETSLTAAQLNAGNLLATYALINAIDAARIDVDALFARDAFIGRLRTAEITSGQSLSLIAGRALASARTHRGETAPGGEILPGDLWVVPSTGEIRQAEAAPDANLQFYLGSDGALYFSCDEEAAALMREYDLHMSGVCPSVSPTGDVLDSYRWAQVQDKALADGVRENRAAFERVVRIDPDGLHVGDSRTPNEVLIDSDSVNIVLENRRYSRFAARYVQFGNYKIGLAGDGGLMFRPM